MVRAAAAARSTSASAGWLGVPPRSETKEKNMARDVVSDLVSVSKRPPVPPVVAKKGAAPVKTAAKPDKNVTDKKPAVSRGAVVRTPSTPRQTATSFGTKDKIVLVEGVRNYRTGGNVELAVKLIKKDTTVESWTKAMGESNNPLPAMGLLRYLHKKGCVSVGGVTMTPPKPRAAKAPPTPPPAAPKAAAKKAATPKVAVPKAAVPKAAVPKTTPVKAPVDA